MGNHYFQTVIFDMDGTLTDSVPLITQGVREVISHYHLDPQTPQQLKRFVGPPLRIGFKKYLDLPETDLDDAVAVYRRFYRPRMTQVPLFAGIEELLQELHARGIKVAVASSKLEELVREIAQGTGINTYLDYIAGTQEKIGTSAENPRDIANPRTRRGKEGVVRHALDQLGKKCSLGRAVMVGDREDDYWAAKNIGIEVIGVSWGAGSRDEFPGAPWVSSITELAELLLANK
ncbi:HAD family hydrolase [Varibaculum vaginae]|uniref:HAD family hydrolase n=1 Tax=Varibaculum vaginae TaxID=2364797 RepID=UPI000F08A04D|nr:HAD hydrolase-like protein [Varibaculum vaginae]